MTSDKSSEAWRNWWPDELMVRLMNRSIGWLERWASVLLYDGGYTTSRHSSLSFGHIGVQ